MTRILGYSAGVVLEVAQVLNESSEGEQPTKMLPLSTV